MGAAQGNRHPPDRDRDRIAPAEYAAMRHGDPRARIQPQRLQPRGFFRNQSRPINRRDQGA